MKRRGAHLEHGSWVLITLLSDGGTPRRPVIRKGWDKGKQGPIRSLVGVLRAAHINSFEIRKGTNTSTAWRPNPLGIAGCLLLQEKDHDCEDVLGNTFLDWQRVDIGVLLRLLMERLGFLVNLGPVMNPEPSHSCCHDLEYV